MLDLFKGSGFGLAILLPLANPLIIVAVFLGLPANMDKTARNQQLMMASIYIFVIMNVACDGG